MKPLLVVGLGNPLMGDEGIGWHLAERLFGDPRLPAGAEVICGGTDLLRLADRMERSRRVIVIDALCDGAEPGSVVSWETLGKSGGAASAGQPPDGLDNRQENAHCLSAVQAIQLLCMTVRVPIRLVGVSVSGASLQSGLSPELAACMPAIVERVLREIG